MIACITYWSEYGEYSASLPGWLNGFFSGVYFNSQKEAKDEVTRIVEHHLGKVPVTFICENTMEVAG